jgi:HEAT repeat protein
MKNGIADVSAGAKGIFADKGAFQHLRRSFDVLTGVDPSLPERTWLYVAQGKEEAVLLDLRNSTKAPGDLLGKPGCIGMGVRVLDEKTRKLIFKGQRERSKFYSSLDRDTMPLDALVRLGKLFVAVDREGFSDHSGGRIPDWLHYLLDDAVDTSFSGYHSNASLKNRGAFGISLVHRLLEQEGAPGTHSLYYVFERKNLENYYWRELSFVLEWPDLAGYMIEHREATCALADTLSAAGRDILARTLGNDPLQQAFPDLLVRLAIDASKAVRATASPLVGRIPEESRLALLEQYLRNGSTGEREQAAGLLGQIPGQAGVQLLLKAQEQESSRTVLQAIGNAITRLDAAHDAEKLEMPDAPPFEIFPDEILGEEAVRLLLKNHVELLEHLRKAAEEESKQTDRGYTWQQDRYKGYSRLTEDQIRDSIAILNGQAPGESTLTESQSATLAYGNRLPSLPGFGLPHLVRWLAAEGRHGIWRLWNDDRFQRWLNARSGKVDLRSIADVLRRAGKPIVTIANDCLLQHWEGGQPQYALPPELVWPFFAEHPEFVEEGLGLRPSTQSGYWQYTVGNALAVLETFPVVPPRFIPRLMELALGDGKTNRPAAQAVLARLPDIGARVVDSLASTRMDKRVVAAEWLARLGHREAAPALYKALKKETGETARAILLTALEKLGEDISPQLAPAILQKEAEKGLSGKIPAGLSWFPLDALPECRWAADDAPVPNCVTKWWVVLACKLKEPAGNALLDRYLNLLSSQGRAVLGMFILQQFIARDTRCPSLDEAASHARSNLAQRMQMYKQWVQWDPRYGEITEEQAFEQLKQEKLGTYLCSAIGEKGILALIAGAPGHEIVSLLQSYMKNHFLRRAQIEAILTAAAKSDDRAVIQLVLSVARRHRTASVQARARALVEEIAARNDWTRDQLADRTIPTAGFDETGRLSLEYGERVFTAVLDEALKPVLVNPEGKEVKALPEPRKMDDPEKIKEAKAQWSACRKELKQVLDLQGSRLYEAMCAGRVWPAAEWLEYLHAHPVVGRLIQRLIWLECDREGRGDRLYRPTEDGSLIDINDEPIELTESGHVRLAHASLVAADVAAFWGEHLKDYKVKPLFAQMTRPLPILPGDTDGAQAIADRLGWMTDTFTLRGAFTKLGYQRAQAEDGGFFYCYRKDFASAGICAVIEFTGNTLPEENVAAALKTLSFEQLGVRGYYDRRLELASVPPILLAEAHADYLTVAGACAGHDPEWEKKVPW